MNEGLNADSADEQPRQQTLGELLLGLPPPQASVSHLSDAGLVLDDPPQPSPAVAAAAAALQQQQQQQQERSQDQQQQQQQQSRGEGDPAAADEEQPESIAAMLQETLLQGNGSNRAELEAMLLR